MAVVDGIASKHGLRIEIHHRYQPNKSKLQYRFNATSHLHLRKRTPLTSFSTLSSMSFNGLELGLKRNHSKQFDKLKMILRVLIVADYKYPAIGS